MIIEQSEKVLENGIKVVTTVNLVDKETAPPAQVEAMRKVRRMFNSWLVETEINVKKEAS